MDLYREGVTDRDRREAAALLGKATSGEKPGTPAADRPSVEVSCPETDPDLAQLLRDKGLTDPEIDEVLQHAGWAWVELNYRPHAYQPPKPSDDQRPSA